jgi:protein dithiol oxidoreductase (disulfide-forming)
MKRTLLTLVALLAAAAAPVAQAQLKWVPGKHYTLIPTQRTQVPAGKVEVMEVFSYGCPACNQFRPVMKQLAAALPKNAQIVYLPASWNAAENWPLFQRMYLTALTLGVADKTHDGMYDAIWTTGELGVVDKSTNRLKTKLPSIEDAAKYYQRVAGVKPADFVTASKSFGVDLKIKQAETQIKAMQIASTPTLVVNGKYRLNNEAFSSVTEIIEAVNFLVAKESAAVAPAKTPAAPAAKPAAAPAKP